MILGYRMTMTELKRLNAIRAERGDRIPWGGFDVDAPAEFEREQVKSLAQKMNTSASAKDAIRDDLALQLAAGKDLFFKQLKLTPALFATLVFVMITAAGMAIWLLGHYETSLLNGVWNIAYLPLAASILATLIALSFTAVRVWCIEAVFAIVGAVVSNLYFVLGLNRLFLRRGRIDRLLNLE
jgi:hypothetical protein